MKTRIVLCALVLAGVGSGCLHIGRAKDGSNPPITSFLRKSDISKVEYRKGTNYVIVEGYKTDGGAAAAQGALQFGLEALKRVPPIVP